MEIVLNLVWFALATGLIVGFSMSDRGSRFQSREWLTLVCLALLLFPVISMSDDMAAMITASERAPQGQDLLLSQYQLVSNSDCSFLGLRQIASEADHRLTVYHRLESLEAPAILPYQCWPEVEKRPPPSARVA